MKIAIVQTNPVFGEVCSNILKALEMMESVHAELFVLPELFNTGYNFIDKREAEQLSEPATGKTFDSIAQFARNRSCYVVYGFAEKADENSSQTSNHEPQTKYYNSAALVGPRGFVGLYRKVHLYNRENLFFTPGDLGFPVFDLPFGRIGIMICFDWIYPESARALALKGAQLIAHPANLVLPHCPDAMVTRCLENRVFAATANRVGKEERGGFGFCYIGKSEIVSPLGEILVRLSDHDSCISVHEVDLGAAKIKRINEFNDLLHGRRVDQYSCDN